ncbi:hypothetical protein EYF80_036337 [Liparis tanakae]|uniref:Uncharacterized protein n=1 Tax=Liparis tanakae TaxID=230148 RepID=A0A4Z2GIW3_9TELE|nr:hypothetical protein EYF80_036337 [Liparis tanakae]
MPGSYHEDNDASRPAAAAAEHVLAAHTDPVPDVRTSLPMMKMKRVSFGLETLARYQTSPDGSRVGVSVSPLQTRGSRWDEGFRRKKLKVEVLGEEGAERRPVARELLTGRNKRQMEEGGGVTPF